MLAYAPGARRSVDEENAQWLWTCASAARPKSIAAKQAVGGAVEAWYDYS